MTNVYAIGVFLALAAATSPAAAAEDDSEALGRAIVERADRVRFPGEAFQVDISVATRSDGQEGDAWKYRVLSKGNENTVVMVTEPAAERGQIMLMKGRDLWVFLPSVSQPVRLALSQRLTGQVANGDLARANFAGDYTPRLLRVDSIAGDQYNVLELLAKDRSVTYHKVIYWVLQGKDWPYKAEFYSLSDRLLKTCRYERYQTMLGKPRPTRLVMEDALRQGEQSVLDYTEMKLRDLPDKLFTKEYLKKLD